MWLGWQKTFDDVTSPAFDDVTTTVSQIIFDDVTANLVESGNGIHRGEKKS